MVYLEWERLFVADLMREWARKKDEAVALLRTRYDELKADPPRVGSDRFWKSWATNYLSVLIGPINDAATIGVRDAIDDIDTRFAIGVDWALANADAAVWAREFAADLAQGLTETDRDNIREALARWIESEDDFPTLIRAVDEVVGDLRRARLIAVTESTRAYAQGNLAAWRRAGVVQQKQWNTAMDERVCPICQPRNGAVVPLDAEFDGIDNPPAHPSCRCWITPVAS